MENPALFHTMPVQQKGWRTYASVGFVVTLHLLALWALALGLGVNVSKVIPGPLIFVPVNPPQRLPHQIPPPNPTMQKPHVTDVPAPRIPIEQNASAGGGIQTTTQQNQSSTTVVPADTGPQSLAGTHMIPPYPGLARRLDHEGTVILTLAIGADGTVTDAQVTTSSGFSELDQAAIEWVKAHWRYKPATHAGNPVSGTARTSVKFALEDAR